MKYIRGDILSENESNGLVLICHQVNCCGVMGAGLAKQIKKKYPVVFSEYKKFLGMLKEIGEDPLGVIHTVRVEPNVAIVNIFGQREYGKYGLHTDYAALRRAFKTIAQLYPNEKIRIPCKIGCGLAGGDWNIVSQIISEELDGCDYEIWQLPIGTFRVGG